jgi:hypothetical protein
VLGVAATAGAKSHPVILERCGYTKAEYGRSAVYPFDMTCAQARAVIAASDDRHAAIVNFGPGWDGGAVAINGRFWVCTGQMGVYGCAYPWRPIAVRGHVGYTGPFTEGVMYETCTGLRLPDAPPRTFRGAAQQMPCADAAQGVRTMQEPPLLVIAHTGCALTMLAGPPGQRPKPLAGPRPIALRSYCG